MAVGSLAARSATSESVHGRTEHVSTSRSISFQAGVLSIEVLSSAAAIEDEWRDLEQSGISTIYQSYDWLDAWRATAMDAYREIPFIVTGRDPSGALSFIWPLAITRRFGVPLLTWLASPVNNYNFGIFAPRSDALEPGVAREILLRVAAQSQKISAIHLTAQPLSWEGHDNPFTQIGAAPTGDFARTLRLETDFSRLFERTVSTQRRQSVRRKQRKISEHGPVSYAFVSDPVERQQFIDALFAQKIEQLQKLRSPCIFSDPSIADFLRRASLSKTAGFTTSLHAMVIGGETISRRWNFIFKDRVYSFNHSCSETSHRSASPGLLHAIYCIELKCAQGLKYFDFGPGPGEHKDFWRPDDTPLVETRYALGTLGWLPLAPGAIRSAAKVQARAHPAALEVIRRARFHARGLIGSLRGAQGSPSLGRKADEE